MNQIKFSIIIPCYNLSNIELRFYNDLKRQTYKNFEVICVDDCSPDNTIDILNDLSKLNEIDLKIFKNENNSGPGVTRNYAISKASGDYITFIDSDDSVTPLFLENLYEGILKYDYPDTLIFDTLRVYKDSNKLYKGIKRGKEGIVNKRKAMLETPGATWGKCYKKSLLLNNNIEFLNQRRYEDVPFTKLALYCSKKIVYLNKVLYHYIDTPTSLVNTKSLTNYNNALNAFEYLANRIDDSYFLKVYFIKDVYYSVVMNLISQECSNKKIYQTLKEVKSKYNYYSWWAKYKTDFHTTVILLLVKLRLLSILKLLLRYI